MKFSRWKKYTTEFKDLKFSEVDFNKYSGFSDHTIGMAAVLEAFRRGASIVEKHFSNNPLAQGEHEGAHLCSFDKEMLSQFKSLTRQLAVLNGGKNVAWCIDNNYKL